MLGLKMFLFLDFNHFIASKVVIVVVRKDSTGTLGLEIRFLPFKDDVPC